MQSVDGASWSLWRSKRSNSLTQSRLRSARAGNGRYDENAGGLPGLATGLVFERDTVFERPRPRGRRRLLLAIAIFAASFLATRFSATVWHQADQIAVMAGFGLDQVAVTGHRQTSEDDIFAAVGASGRDQGMHATLTLDVLEARHRIEALAWVKTARVIRQLPNAIDIEIAEREPFAVWQRRGLVFLIDRDGRTLQAIAPTEYPSLPLIVGEGADKGAAGIFDEIARNPELASQVSAVVRVADRRWSLQLRNGIEVMLPVTGSAGALQRLAELQHEGGLLERAIEVVDLRDLTRVVVRLSEAGEARRKQLRIEQRKLALASSTGRRTAAPAQHE